MSKRGKQHQRLPYESASSGTAARTEIIKILRRLGCEEVGFMDDFEKHEVLLQFVHRGRQATLRVSAKGWAQMFLKKNPWTSKRRSTRQDYEQDALRQGYIAINSTLRDWVKGSVTAVECGMLSFEAVFMPFMLTSDGRPLIERLAETNLLPAPTPAKVVSITSSSP